MTVKYDILRLMTERMLGLEVKTPKDFERLANHIYSRTGKMLSVSTLKRFWGYVDKERTETRTVRISTLDILSEYIGYQNWALFCQTDLEGTDESDTMANRHLFARELKQGTLIELRWQPNRSMVIRYEGDEVFTVVESIQSKLRPGDTFHCPFIIDGMQLTIFRLVRDGEMLGNYVCGKTHGVTFSRK
jgi:hypothetical protein